MRIAVALLALFRCCAKINVHQLHFQVRRLMAFDTGYGSMRTLQLEACTCVIELRKVLPRLHGMAGHALKRLSIRSALQHAFAELPFMWILMTGCAIKTCEPVRNNFHRFHEPAGLV